ncbi:MAG: bifunctional ADP-dependent NAD(P)H-hydrate dehydratase/NAD(P)H-hydrate epimerase [Treponema sp.]|jgi:NAD(P)H-hydrate epimerase|nr:bifunctional ADP-dependent NAD(P)H-hydrate dehydratase/NAD(P)H-hydrate epimerase [Treponema sp.]
MMSNKKLVSAKAAAQLDKEASTSWGLNAFALIEAVGRTAASRLVHAFPTLFQRKPKIIVFAGSGNNGADAMAMVRSLILRGKADDALLILKKTPDVSCPQTPHSQAFISLVKMNVPFLVWNAALPSSQYREKLETFDIILDGVTGSGLEGAIKNQAAEMVSVINEVKHARKISIDMPSGNFDGWNNSMPIVRADATLAIEPLKLCLYTPAARPFAGTIISVDGIFPQALMDAYAEAELLDWETENRNIPMIQPDAYKYSRGVVEIHAGSIGATGAARIAARGAEASGAGLIRLLVDEDIYPIVASSSGGVMVAPDIPSVETRFPPDALLVGPGWGRDSMRLPALQKAIEQDIPLVLDADAICLAKDVAAQFNGKTILTPHVGEFSAFSGASKEEILANPIPILKKTAHEKKAVVLFKSHVMFIAAEDGRIGVVDGMTPVLGSGGSGDLLAGLCAGIAGRVWRTKLMEHMKKNFGAIDNAASFDAYTCACTAATLLIAAGKNVRGFVDAFVLADNASQLAADAWLGRQQPQ